MTEYLQVAKHLGVVRRAWKRAAALAGLAIVCIESVGLLTVALVYGWLRREGRPVAAAVAALALATAGHFTAISRVRSKLEPAGGRNRSTNWPESICGNSSVPT